MIRRDVQLPDGSRCWALISQIEHARISALLASQCRGRFGSVQSSLIRDEALVAIAAHDDGWREWDEAPQLDVKLGRPLSFMELAVADATTIWSKSITIAEEIGPLAAWMVSGHFARLLQHSEHARHEPLASSWLAEIGPRREAWFATWQAIDPADRDLAVANEALQWLWTFDEASLWLCCSAPIMGEPLRAGGSFEIAGCGTTLEMKFAAISAAAASPDERGQAITTPWRFDDGIDVDIESLLVPAGRYATPQKLLAAGRPQALRWRLASPTACA